MVRILFNKAKQKRNKKEQKQEKLEILQSLGGLYDGLALYALHWS